jgi:hypothetical protein
VQAGRHALAAQERGMRLRTDRENQERGEKCLNSSTK